MLRGHTYFAVKEVPRPLQAKLGRRLMKTLKTTDHRVAVAQRHAVLAEFERAFERAREATGGDSITEAAQSWQDTLHRLERGDKTAFAVSGPDGPITDLGELRAFATGLIDEETWDIKHEHGWDAARTFAGVATGSATPLLMNLEPFLAEAGAKGRLNPRTAAQYRADVHAFATWAKEMGAVTVESVTAATAGRFITEQMVKTGVHPATGNRKITAMSAYWRWMCKRAGVASNPWMGQSLSTGHRRVERPKRPFTDAEVVTLFAGEADRELADAMRVAALTGARIEELYRLTVTDCAGGWFQIWASKTRAGVRRVPVHTDLAGIIARRCAGKAAGAYLFHEVGPLRAGRERSMSLSQRFTRYRRACDVDDRADGARHSKIDLHSFRRWFITKARNAGIDRAVVAAVVGHATGSITDDVYSGGPSDALLRACVEAVRLPAT